MSLQNLVISNKQISAELIENILIGKVNLIQEGRRVNLTKESLFLPNKNKILLYLAGGKAWELLDNEIWESSPNDMQEILGIPGNTLRPILKDLTDNFSVKSKKGKYQIMPKGIYGLQSMLDNSKHKEKTGLNNNSRKTKKSSAKKTVSGPPKSKAIEELITEGYFSNPRELGEIQLELGRRGITIKSTSLPSYILPLVRNKILTRDYKAKGKGKVWIYSLYNNKK